MRYERRSYGLRLGPARCCKRCGSMPGASRGTVATDHPSSGGGRSVVADLGAGSGGGLTAIAAAAPRLPRAPRSGAGRNGWRRRRGCGAGRGVWVLEQDARARRRCCCRWRTRCGSRHCGQRRPADHDAAGVDDWSAVDECACGVSCRHQRCAADRAGGGDCAVVPAARTSGQ